MSKDEEWRILLDNATYQAMVDRIADAVDPRVELERIRFDIERGDVYQAHVRERFEKIQHILNAVAIELHGREASKTHGPIGVENSPTATPPPGYRLASIARLFLTRDAFDRYVAPVIADMQEEYTVAVTDGRTGRARWICIRGHMLVIPGWLYGFFSGKLAKLFRSGN